MRVIEWREEVAKTQKQQRHTAAATWHKSKSDQKKNCSVSALTFLSYHNQTQTRRDGVDVDEMWGIRHRSSFVSEPKETFISAIQFTIDTNTCEFECCSSDIIRHNNCLCNSSKSCGAIERLRSFIYNLSTINQKRSICSRRKLQIIRKSNCIRLPRHTHTHVLVVHTQTHTD